MHHFVLSVALVLTSVVPTIASGADGSPQPGTVAPGSVKFVVHRVGTFRSEVCGVADFNGDGKPLEILPHAQRTVWYELAKRPDGSRGFAVHLVSEKKMAYGGGVGDINGDGDLDVVVTRKCGGPVWFENKSK